ncbi:MAG TPA: hypothetical protein VLC53_01280 [Myxococcota bacterium]|nr:hypothetical protein [Myxococcota bacterium]
MSCAAVQEALEAQALADIAPEPSVRAHLAACADCAAHERFLRALGAALAAQPAPAPSFELLARTRERATRALRAHAPAPARGLLRELAAALAVLTLALPPALAHAWLVAEGATALLGGILPPLLLEGLGVAYFGSLALAVGALYAVVPLWVASLRRARTEAP